MLRSALLALVLTLPAPATDLPLAGEPTPYLIDNNIIPKLICGKWMGTGVYVAPGIVATARHVAGKGNCTIAGKRTLLIGGVSGRDFVLLAVNANPEYRALIDCSGIHEGQQLLATGYAEDADRTVTQRLTGSSAVSSEKGFEGLSIMRGSITQGMSGGPVVDLNTGALVGIVNANSADGVTVSLAFPLSKTPLCEGKA